MVVFKSIDILYLKSLHFILVFGLYDVFTKVFPRTKKLRGRHKFRGRKLIHNIKTTKKKTELKKTRNYLTLQASVQISDH